MTDVGDIGLNSSQDSKTYRRGSISDKRKTSMTVNRTSENYYSNRNCPEILSLLALTNRDFQYREKRIYQSIASGTHDFSMINYPLQSSLPTTMVSSVVLEDHPRQDQQPMFPKLAPRSTTVKKAPALTPTKSPSNDIVKAPIPRLTTSVKPVPPSSKVPLPNRMPMIPTNKKKTIHLSQHLHGPE